jgi:hypothetical protein
MATFAPMLLSSMRNYDVQIRKREISAGVPIVN